MFDFTTESDTVVPVANLLGSKSSHLDDTASGK